MATAEELEAIARQVNNWGRWGTDDQLGTLNLITPDVRRAASGCVRTGQALSLALPLTADGVQTGLVPGRFNPIRTMVQINEAQGEWGTASSDDMAVLSLQGATHWDGLAHVSWKGTLYNGYDARTVTAAGASKLGIHHVGALATRGVLLDVARALGVEALDPGYPVTAADLDAAEELGRVAVRAGDAVVVRTGHMVHLRRDDKLAYLYPSPGLGTSTPAWFHRRDVAAVATDTLVFECYPYEDMAMAMPVHRLDIVEMGLTQGQNFDLDALADACAADGVYDFLLEASPLPFVQACGAPVAPVALR
ncbi:MAG: cyclase family protein [Acidimicrobiales bacterium]